MKQSNSFEATYTRYSFAPLVALGVAIAAGLVSAFGKTSASPHDGDKSLVGSGHQLAA